MYICLYMGDRHRERERESEREHLLVVVIAGWKRNRVSRTLWYAKISIFFWRGRGSVSRRKEIDAMWKDRLKKSWISGFVLDALFYYLSFFI